MCKVLLISLFLNLKRREHKLNHTSLVERAIKCFATADSCFEKKNKQIFIRKMCNGSNCFSTMTASGKLVIKKLTRLYY